MSEAGTFFSDFRRRNIAVLAGTAVVSVLLAAIGLHEQAVELAPKYTPETFLPGIASKIGDATKLHIVSNKGTFDVVKTDKGWVLTQRGNYPASFDEVQKTLVGMAGLETIEPKTSRPDWLHYVDLETPPKGNGILISAAGGDGREIASVIFGKSEDIGDPGGATGLFARRSSEDQSYLVRAVFTPKGDPGDWMDKNIVNIDRSRIQEVDVTPTSGAAYVLRRDKPSDPDFKPTSIPRGRELSNDAAGDSVAAAITGLSFEDVKAVATLDFSEPTHLVTKTFDGLTVTVDTVQRGQDYWARISASAEPGNSQAQAEMTEINTHAGSWAYKLPAYKGQQFMSTLESLLKPLGSPAKTEP
jgi:hypothetical protein